MPEDNYIHCYWLDSCTVCGAPCVSACWCPRNDRSCENGHVWQRQKDGTALLLTSSHGAVIGKYPKPEEE